MDVSIVYLTLLAYTLNDNAAVALKNPVFFIIYPLIGITVFRYDPRLTLVIGGFVFLAYGVMFSWAAPFTAVQWGDYASELFGPGAMANGRLCLQSRSRAANRSATRAPTGGVL